MTEFPQPGTAHAERFRVDAALARRYAMNSGDWNPIHLTDMTSRAFGFERTILHGMWSLARCAGTFSPEALHRPCTLDAAFKAPAYLPADLTVYTWATESGEAFALRNSDNQRAHLTGVLTLDAAR
jgi:acyl dehydratase